VFFDFAAGDDEFLLRLPQARLNLFLGLSL